MQTQKQFEAKLGSMLPDILSAIRDEAIRLFQSGAVDPSNHHDNFVLPKICLVIALGNVADRYMPHEPSLKREAANLKHF